MRAIMDKGQWKLRVSKDALEQFPALPIRQKVRQ
jgi:hypothetical protein